MTRPVSTHADEARGLDVWRTPQKGFDELRTRLRKVVDQRHVWQGQWFRPLERTAVAIELSVRGAIGYPMRDWQLQDAKNRFSELVRRAREERGRRPSPFTASRSRWCCLPTPMRH